METFYLITVRLECLVFFVVSLLITHPTIYLANNPTVPSQLSIGTIERSNC